MPYKDPQKNLDNNRLARRRERGFKRGNRPQVFAEKFKGVDLSLLSPKEREAMERYWLKGETTTAIGAEWGVSRQRIGKILKDCEKKLLADG